MTTPTTSRPRLLAALLTLALSAPAFGGTFTWSATTDKPPVSYEPGETMTFRIQLWDDGQPAVGKALAWTRDGDDGKKENGTAVSAAEPLAVTASLAEPGFVHIQVAALDDQGQPLLNPDGKKVAFDGGAAVHPEALQGVAEPSDFDAYWDRQKARMAEVPLKTLEMVPVPEKRPGVDTFDVKIAAPGGMPVSGYYSKPHAAAPKSAGARIGFVGYGVAGAPRLDDLAGNAAAPMIVLSINAHGIENGKDDAYYANLKDTTLKYYAFDPQQNAKPETAYFQGMIFRVLRAIEFLKAQPEWDGKVLIAAGGSQGGFQALLAAALDPAVTQCLAGKPWCCDLAGITLGRMKGWRPELAAGLPYFDPINHAKRIHCPTDITIGLGDYTCPPSGVSVLYNNVASATKSITYVQGATHPYEPPNAERQKLSKP